MHWQEEVESFNMYKRSKDNKYTCTFFFLNNINKNLEIKVEKKNSYKIKCNQSLSKIHNLRGENPLKKKMKQEIESYWQSMKISHKIVFFFK